MLSEIEEFNKKILEESINDHKNNITNKEKENKELKESIAELEKIDSNIAVGRELVRKGKTIKDNEEDIDLSRKRIDRYQKELSQLNKKGSS